MYGFVVVFIHLCSVAGEVSARGIERVWPLIKDDIKHKVMEVEWTLLFYYDILHAMHVPPTLTNFLSYK